MPENDEQRQKQLGGVGEIETALADTAARRGNSDCRSTPSFPADDGRDQLCLGSDETVALSRYDKIHRLM